MYFAIKICNKNQIKIFYKCFFNYQIIINSYTNPNVAKFDNI